MGKNVMSGIMSASIAAQRNTTVNRKDVIGAYSPKGEEAVRVECASCRLFLGRHSTEQVASLRCLCGHRHVNVLA